MGKTKKVQFESNFPIPSPPQLLVGAGETSQFPINNGYANGSSDKSKSLIISSEKVSDHLEPQQEGGDAIDREALLEKVEMEKRFALIQAWEESEKTKAEAKAYKKLSGVGAWEVSKRAILEVELKVIEEKYERKMAEKAHIMYEKQMKVLKVAEEKRATILARKGEDVVTVEESAAKFRANGYVPKRLFGRFC